MVNKGLNKLAARRNNLTVRFFILPWFVIIFFTGGKAVAEKGKVKWFSNQKGYGFIALESGDDVFVHYSAIDGDGYKGLEEGQEVELEIEKGPKGEHATKVVKI